MKTVTDSFRPITGYYRELVFLLAALCLKERVATSEIELEPGKGGSERQSKNKEGR